MLQTKGKGWEVDNVFTVQLPVSLSGYQSIMVVFTPFKYPNYIQNYCTYMLQNGQVSSYQVKHDISYLSKEEKAVTFQLYLK